MSRDITPKTHFLASIRGDRGSYWSLLAEGVDNALDAGARTVTLELSGRRIVLVDDGSGIDHKREDAIVQLGLHSAMPTTSLGRFGIGIKYQAISAGDHLLIASTSADGKMRLFVDWSRVERSGEWKIDDPEWHAPRQGSRTGTRIEIAALRWPAPKPSDISTTRAKLAEYFYPALADRNITLNGESIPELAEPPLESLVEGDIALDGGLWAKVRAGIISAGADSRLRQVQLVYRHRVLKPNSSFGCGSYGGLRRMFARVDLSGPWELTRFKDGIDAKHEIELDEQLQHLLAPILDKCQSESIAARVEELEAELNDRLPGEWLAARPIRSRTEPRETTEKKPRVSGKTNNGTPGGPAKKRATNGVMIEFVDGINDEHGLGYFEDGRPSRIRLASDNPLIGSLIQSRDAALSSDSLLAIAFMIYQHTRDNLHMFSNDIGKKVALLIEQQTTLNGGSK